MIVGLDRVPSIIVSAVISVTYTLIGGLLSVAYTDVFQISLIGLGLVRILELRSLISISIFPAHNFAELNNESSGKYHLYSL